MKDFNKPLRKAVYEALNGQLSYNSSNVPVFDQKVKKTADNSFYVVIGNISSSNGSTFASWQREMDVVLDIVTKTQDTVSTNIADAIAEQILGVLMPTITDNGLSQSGFQYSNFQLSTDRYLDLQLNPTTAMVRRLMTFSITVNQE